MRGKEHPYFRVIENLNGFEDKMRHLIAEIASFLGDPAPFEIRRRLLIDKPDPSVLEAFPGCHRFEIEQVYLLAPPDEEIRVRMRRGANGVVYYLTRKKGPAGYRSLISEGRLSEREYQQFLGNADPSRQMICKTRYCLTWKQQYFEIDLYPFWDNRAVLEVSLREADEKIAVPDFLHVQRDVSEDPVEYLFKKQERESFKWDAKYKQNIKLDGLCGIQRPSSFYQRYVFISIHLFYRHPFLSVICSWRIHLISFVFSICFSRLVFHLFHLPCVESLYNLCMIPADCHAGASQLRIRISDGN